MKNTIKVHIADDHKILIEGIIAVINTDNCIDVEGYSLTGKQVIDWIKSNMVKIFHAFVHLDQDDIIGTGCYSRSIMGLGNVSSRHL